MLNHTKYRITYHTVKISIGQMCGTWSIILIFCTHNHQTHKMRL